MRRDRGEVKMLTHINESGRAKMVDVGEKDETLRIATARGRITMRSETFERIMSGGVKKGDVLAVAQVAGIMGAKRTSDLVPMCHPIFLTGVDMTFGHSGHSTGAQIWGKVGGFRAQ